MERLCSWCGLCLGERCKRCGSERVKTFLDARAMTKLASDMDETFLFTSSGYTAVNRGAANPSIMRCEDCGNFWEQGADGVTHGMCAACMKIAIQEREEQPAN